MAPPKTYSNSASNSHNPSPSSSLDGRLDNGKKIVVSILKDTDWPKEALNDVQNLIQTMETAPDVRKLTKNETQKPGELENAIEHFLEELEGVRASLKKESEKYGTRKKGFRREVKKLLSRASPSECSEVLKSCRATMEKALATLTDHLSDQDTASKQHSLQGAEAEADDGSGTQPDTNTPATVSLPPSTGIDLSTNAPQPNSPPNQAPPNMKTEKQKVQWRGELLNGAKTAFKFVDGVSGALPVVGSYFGAVAKVGLTVVEMVQAMDDNDETAERLGTHVCRLSAMLERFSNQPRKPESSQTTNGMVDLQRELRFVQREIEELQAQPSMKKFWRSGDQSGSLKNLQEKVRAALEEIQLLANLDTSILVAELHNESMQNKNRHLLDRLGNGKYGARGNAIEDVTCLPGTRVEILERIDDWVRGGSNSERVLWICGMAGRGKSTIASTVAHNWKGRACCAIYHFRRGQNEPDSSLVCALARQLGRSLDPELKNAILSTVEENDDIANQRLEEQFNTLFVASLKRLNDKAFPILVIVDALDECDSAGYAVDFVKLIDRHSAALPDNIKFLLTSRPEAPLLRALEPRKWHAESLDSIADVDADIKRFLRHALLQVKEEHDLEDDWPSPDDVTELVRMSQGLFQWARTIVKWVSDGSPTDRLSELLESPSTWSGVDELYTQILSKALNRVKASQSKQNLLLRLLGTLVAAQHPVSLEAITFLHAEDGLIKGKPTEKVFNFLRREILADLTSLLFIPASSVEPVRPMHTSVRDLLVDRDRCGEQPYLVDLEETHQRLTVVCIRQMNRHLRENICNLSDISTPISEVQDVVEHELSKGLQYCCRSWSAHLTAGKGWPRSGINKPDSQESDFKRFSEEKVLQWLEILSVLGSTSDAIAMAKQAQGWLMANRISGSDSLVTLWSDVQRFVTAFSEPISFSPLHIYVSAMGHCPSETELWKRYGCHAKVQTIRGLQSPEWPSNLWSRSVGSVVESVALERLRCNDFQQIRRAKQHL